MNRLSFYHFANLKNYIPLLKSRETFLSEQWLNIFNRTIYVTIPLTMDSSVLTPVEKLNILERYFIDVSKQIKAGSVKEVGIVRSMVSLSKNTLAINGKVVRSKNTVNNLRMKRKMLHV